MPWQCWSCGRFGDRNQEKTWCHREGVVSLRGSDRCCLCMKGAGWEQFWDFGCINCHKINGTYDPTKGPVLKFVSPFEQLKAQQEKDKATALEATALEATIKKQPELVVRASKIAVFEFDGVLFRTPPRPSWWPFNGYEAMMESLLEPTVPTIPSDEWWNLDTLKAAKDACEDQDTWAVLISYRGDYFDARIKALLLQRGIVFNEVRLRSVAPWMHRLGATAEGECGYGGIARNLKNPPQEKQEKHTLSVLGDLISRCSYNQPTLSILSHVVSQSTCAQDVQIWASRRERAGQLQMTLEDTPKVKVQIHAVELESHVAGTPTPEQLATMKNAEKALQDAKQVQETNNKKHDLQHELELAQSCSGPPSHMARVGKTPEGLPAREKAKLSMHYQGSKYARMKLQRALEAKRSREYLKAYIREKAQQRTLETVQEREVPPKKPGLRPKPGPPKTNTGHKTNTGPTVTAQWPADVYLADTSDACPLLWWHTSIGSGSIDREEEEEDLGALSPSMRRYIYDRETGRAMGDRKSVV